MPVFNNLLRSPDFVQGSTERSSFRFEEIKERCPVNGGYAEQFTESARVRYPYQEDGEFHRVGVEWSPQGYIFYLDGKETARSSGPVSQIEQFILLTTEVVGYRSGNVKTYLTEEERQDKFVCDYVRVFDLES